MVEKTNETSIIDQFECIQYLGSGGQGKVKLAINHRGERFALKFFELPTLLRLVVIWRYENKFYEEEIPNKYLEKLIKKQLIEEE